MKLAIFILILFLAIGAKADEWLSVESQHFLIMYTQGNEDQARDIQQMAEEFLTKVTSDFGYSPGRKITIWFHKSKKEFHKSANAPIQDWAAGYAYPLHARIDIYDPESMGDKRLNLYRLIKHEVTHVIFGLYLGDNLGNIPRWFNEGLAMYESQEWSYGNYWTMLAGVLGGSIIPLNQLIDDFPQSEPQARMAYTQSNSIVAFIVERYGINALKDCIKLLSEGKNFDEALIEAIGFDSQWLERLWHSSLKKRYRWISFISNWSVLWIIAVLLLLLGYLQYRLKKRRKYKEWETEEMWDEYSDYEGDSTEDSEE